MNAVLSGTDASDSQEDEEGEDESASQSQSQAHQVSERQRVNIDKWYKKLTYREIKKVLIRVKTRKFLVQECTICLDAITNESMCRMLNCYHIFHVECIDSWFTKDPTCPNCKKVFEKDGNLKFNINEFLQTINVDNEHFYSDHLIRNSHRLASTRTIVKFDPFYKEKGVRRRLSFDLGQFMRKDDYMRELRADESH